MVAVASCFFKEPIISLLWNLTVIMMKLRSLSLNVALLFVTILAKVILNWALKTENFKIHFHCIIFEFIQDNFVVDMARKIYSIRWWSNWWKNKFNDDKEVKTFTQNFFKSKDKNFYSNNIDPLPLKWKTIINNDGELIE